MLCGRVDRGSFPPSERVQVISMASCLPPDEGCTFTRWSLDDLAGKIVNEAHHQAMSRSTIHRILEAADLKPHRSVYWLNSHDPEFDAKAKQICELYVKAPQMYEQGRLLICTDEKTGMQILERKHPTLPAEPGKPERREPEYIRHGTRALIASFIVPTGQVEWNLGVTRTSQDFAAHLRHVAEQHADKTRFDWVLDNLNTHWSLDVCKTIAELSDVPFISKDLATGPQRIAFLNDPEHKHTFHFTPKHGSWLNQVELWFSVLERRFLRRGDFRSPEEFTERLGKFLNDYNANYAHPYCWTYTGEPLVRNTPFCQTRRQKRHGRAWLGPRPRLFQRLFDPARPYKRSSA